MNYIEILKKWLDDVELLINDKIKNISRDITFKAQVVEKISDEKYKILYKKQYHTAWCLANLTMGSVVRVCAPGNDWNELFINQSCTRKEFEQLKSNVNRLIDLYVQTNGNSLDLETQEGGLFSNLILDIDDLKKNTVINLQYNPEENTISVYKFGGKINTTKLRDDVEWD